MWEILAMALIAIAVILLPFVLLYLRRRWLTGQGGLFDCAYRFSEKTPGSGWVLGMARYRGEHLEWFRAFSLTMRPKRTFSRVGAYYVSQRLPAGLEAIALFEDSLIVNLRDRLSGESASLSMSRDEVLALMSWLESAPPGSYYRPSSADSPNPPA